jgi:hypothetical protein
MLKYAMSLSRLMIRREDYDWICASHGTVPINAIVLEHHLQAALRALEGEYHEITDFSKWHDTAGFAFRSPETKKCVELGNISIIFDERYLYDTAEYNHANRH